MSSFDKAVERAWLLMAVETLHAAAVSTDTTQSDLQELKGQISLLTEQVAALLASGQQRPHTGPKRCNNCVLVTSGVIALALGFQVTPVLDTDIPHPKNRTPPEGLPGVGNRPRDDCDGQSSFPHLVRLTSINTVTAATARA